MVNAKNNTRRLPSSLATSTAAAAKMSTPLPVPSIVDRTKNWLRLLKRRSGSSSIRADQKQGFFSHAQDIVIKDSQLIDVNEMKINYINSVISSRDAVFELLEPYACLEATKDSSARYPPPKCHPETRLKIRDKLRQWLVSEHDGWRMLWVRGSAGTGKSAVAQSFGDSCEEEEIFGGSYFFSRTAGRNKLETVVPTLVHQLARSVPEYHSLIERKLAKDQFLLRSSPPIQFRKLIVESFATLQRQCPRKPIVIILDGLDECEGEKAQREILDLITNAIRTNPDLPLRWLILSRPEAHLKNTFSRNSECGREELIIDDECRGNVERYVRDRLGEIKATYNDMLPAEWPPEEPLQELIDSVSGLFVFASTCLNYIDDPEAADPRSQLDSLLTFMRQSQGFMSRNPLASLDLLYSRILEDIPPAVYKTTWRSLAYMSLHHRFYERLDSAQALSSFLRLDQPTFYKAVRGIHSVTDIPEPADAAKSQLQFHHASFLDFLVDPHRSGRFVITVQEALSDVMRSGVYWYGVDAMLFHTGDEWNVDYEHEHGCLPGLTWASDDNRLDISQSITTFIDRGLFNENLDLQLNDVDGDLLSQIYNLDFRHWSPENVLLLVRLLGLDPSTSVVRIEPSSSTDHQLLEYFNLVIANGIAKPAIFPLRKIPLDDQWTREFFFMGHGMGSVIAWRTKSPGSPMRYTHSLRCDQEPSEALISEYREYLQQIEWDDEKARLEMKEAPSGDRDR